jgi:hypothetical protein
MSSRKAKGGLGAYDSLLVTPKAPELSSTERRAEFDAQVAELGLPKGTAILDRATGADVAGPISITEWENTPQTNYDLRAVESAISRQKNTGWSALSFGDNVNKGDAAEFMRDQMISIGTTQSRKKSAEGFTEDEKKSYARLVSSYEGTYNDDFMEAAKDIAVDVITGPEMLATAFLGVATGGGSVAAQVGAAASARQIAYNLGKKALSTTNLTNRTGMTTLAGGAAGGHDLATQNLEIQLGLREEFNPTQTLIVGAVGAVAGFGISGIANKVVDGRAAKVLAANLVREEARLLDDPINRLMKDPILNEITDSGDSRAKNLVGDSVKAILEKQSALDSSLRIVKAADLDNPEVPLKNLEDRIVGLQTATEAKMEKLMAKLDTATPEEASRLQRELDETVAELDTASLDYDNLTIAQSVEGMMEMQKNITRQTQELGDTVTSVFEAVNTFKMRGEKLSPEKLAELPQLQAFIKSHGGGEKTLVETAEAITLNVGLKDDPDFIAKAVSGKLVRGFNYVNSDIGIAKLTAYLIPFAKVSPRAEALLHSITPEFAKQWKGKQKRIGFGLSEVYGNYMGAYMKEFMESVEPVARTKGSGKLDGIMSTETNALIGRTMRGEYTSDKTANLVGTNLRNLYSKIGTKLEDLGLIDEKIVGYTHRMWHRQNILDNPKKFKDLLVSEGQAPDAAAADKIFEGMMNLKNQLDTGGAAPTFFSKKRTFNDIGDDSAFAEFFEQDVRLTMSSYIHQSAKAIAKMETLGVRNMDEFEKVVIAPIISQVEKAGGPTMTKEVLEMLTKRLRNTYSTVTTEGLDRYGSAGTLATDIYSTATRVSLLGMATVSSLTEPMINLHRAGFRNSIAGFSSASNAGYKILRGDYEAVLKSNFNLTAKEVKRELYEVGLAMEHGMMSVSNRLVGEEVQNTFLQGVNEKFFKLNFLDQWTKFVQSVSFVTGKKLIHGHLQALAANGGVANTKRLQSMLNDLADLNVDVEAGMKWVTTGGSKTTDDFYTQVKQSAGRYSKDIILQPTAMAGQKAAKYSDPRSAFIFQLLTYPTVFSNTILKGMVKKMSRDGQDPAQAMRLASAAYIMTETQRFLNDIRSNGKSEQYGTAHAYRKAAERWGAFSRVGDSLTRASDSSSFVGNATPYLTMLGGVAAGDLATLYTQGPFTFFGQRFFPGYTIASTVASASGSNAVKDYTKTLRNLDDFITPERRTPIKEK